VTLPWTILSEAEGAQATEGESKDREDTSPALRFQGVLYEDGHGTILAMRDGQFYKFWVYIMGSRTGTLYVGMTGFLDQRVVQHKSGLIDGFTKKYGVNRLLYYEV